MTRLNFVYWAPFSDAVKMILTGSESLPLTPEQRTIFLNLIAAAGRDEDGNKVSKPHLPDVRSQERVTNVDTGEVEIVYYIPDLARSIVLLARRKKWRTPKMALNYLKNLENESQSLEISEPGTSLADLEWEQSFVSAEYWQLLSDELDLEARLREVAGMHHNNDPLKLEAITRLQKEFTAKLKKIRAKIASYGNSASVIPTETVGPLPQPVTWKSMATKLAKKLKKEKPKLSNAQLAEQIHVILKEQNITGRGGKVPSASTIERHATQNISRKKTR